MLTRREFQSLGRDDYEFSRQNFAGHTRQRESKFGASVAYNLPSSAKIMIMIRMKPTIPDGPYPQARLWPHVGMTPSRTRMRMMIRMVPRDMMFPRFVDANYAAYPLDRNHLQTA